MAKLDLLKKYISIPQEDFWSGTKNSHEKYLRNELEMVAFLIQDMPEEDIEEEIEHYKSRIVVRRIDLLEDTNIVFVPAGFDAFPPACQEDCVLDNCQQCHKGIWVSKINLGEIENNKHVKFYCEGIWVSKLNRKKRENNKHIKFYCVGCVISAIQSGFNTKNFEGMHLSKMQ